MAPIVRPAGSIVLSFYYPLIREDNGQRLRYGSGPYSYSIPVYYLRSVEQESKKSKLRLKDLLYKRNKGRGAHNLEVIEELNHYNTFSGTNMIT